jgi:arginyl-tRNA synthetase
MIQETIKNLIERALASLGVPKDMVVINLDHPTDITKGDYSTNVAMALFKSLGATSKSPFELAEKIIGKINEELKGKKESPIEKVEAAQPGFINFFLTPKFFTDTISEILTQHELYGKNKKLWNKKIIIEHTNFNPYKPVHIGHLVNNAIGESLSRLLEYHDVKLTRASYGGDVGMHVAKALWGIMKLKSDFNKEADAKNQVLFIGKAYAYGAEAFDTNKEALKEIQDINKKVYEKSDAELNELYTWGRNVSLEYFATVYKLLGTRFDVQFWESEVADIGKEVVLKYLEQGIFEKSEGAIIFPGEKYGLHSRVFITSQGLPTYEGKEVGLTRKKFELHDFDQSLIITGNEQDDYFRVITEALKHMYPEIGNRTKHIGHGVLRLTTGKMSSRKGNVITMEDLIDEVQAMVTTKMSDKDYSNTERIDIAEKVAIAAIKYSILKQSVGKDVVFDPEKSISFEGDSGPYLQYSYVRSKSILAKAHAAGIKGSLKKSSRTQSALERKLHIFPEIVERAATDFAPNYIATYLIDLAGEFNAYYAKNKIVDEKDELSPYKVALTEAVTHVLKNGMHLLGFDVPEKM